MRYKDVIWLEILKASLQGGQGYRTAIESADQCLKSYQKRFETYGMEAPAQIPD